MVTVEVNPRLQAALLYSALGWPVVPLHTPTDGVCDCPKRDKCESPGKHPRTMHGLDDATTDEAKIRRWWGIWSHANIAIDLVRAGLVDVAPDSVEWYAEFVARGLPETLRFASGGGDGHAHHLYVRPTDCPAYRLTESGQYDVLSAGYAVMPPSLHRSGRLYTWIEPADGLPIATAAVTAPEWAVGMLQERTKKAHVAGRISSASSDTDEPPVRLGDDDLEIWHGRSVIEKPGGIDRSDSLWRIARVLTNAGASPHVVAAALAERDITLGWRCYTDRSDAATQYWNAAIKEGPAVESKRVRLKSDEREPATRVRRAPKVLRFMTASELAATEDEDVRWFVHGLLGAGLIGELDGKAKQAGKTTLLLFLARAILYGLPFLGNPTTYTPVVYLTEQSGPSFKRNLQRAGLLDRDDFHLLLWSETAGEPWASVVEQARQRAREVGAGVLIVDTLAQFSGIRGDQENSSGAAMETMEPLQAATADGLAILVSRHDRKSGGEVGDSGRGSSAYAGAVDIVVHLQRVPASERQDRAKQRLLDGISRFEETPDQVVIELQTEEPYSYTLVGDQATLRDVRGRIELLAMLPVGHSDAAPLFDEIRKELGMREMDARRLLRELIAEDLVERFDHPFRYCQKVSQFADD